MYQPEIALEKLGQIGYLRDKYEIGKLDNENLTPYEHFLVSEWNRCKSLTVDNKPGLILNDKQFDSIKNENIILLDKSTPILNDTAHIMTDVPALLVLSDRFGNVLKIIGDWKVRKKAENVQIMEGAVWSEDITGNNGIGTAIIKKQTVFVTSSEHYWENLDTFCCAGTPILNPYTSEVLGVIDITCLKNLRCKDAAILTHLLAKQIQAEYLIDIALEKYEIIETYLDLLKKYPKDTVVVMDSFGKVVKTNHESCKDNYNIDVILDEIVHSEDILSKNGLKVIGKYYILRKTNRGIPANVSSMPIVYGEFLTLNAGLVKILDSVKKIASTNVSIMINGESGTGKEIIAKYVHEQSNKKECPFIAVNCAQITTDLYASAFFGYEKGAFTGADSSGRKGYFELAHGGTLFLDEIGEMPLNIQAALLRVIETKSFSRIGSEKVISADFRVIAATNRQLDIEVANGKFREDLYYRLNVANFTLPPLRKRPEDIQYLTWHLTKIFCRKHECSHPGIDQKVMDVFLKYSWPGNVRELKNVVELMVIYGEGNIVPSNIPENVIKMIEEDIPLKIDDICSIHTLNQKEPNELVLALQKHEKKYLAAKELGISRSTLYRRLKNQNKL